jgi:hypothetical protein
MTIGPEHYGPLGRVGNAIYVIAIALAIMFFLLSVWGNINTASTVQDVVIDVGGAAVMSLGLWGLAWVIRWALGGGPAK